MDNKSTYSVVQEFLLRQDTFDENFLERVPPGWKNLIKMYYDAVILIGGMPVRWSIKKGLFRPEANPKENPVLGWLSNGVAKASSKICMISGNFAIRRKSAKGWPCIEWSLWIEYSNEMPEGEWLT